MQASIERKKSLYVVSVISVGRIRTRVGFGGYPGRVGYFSKIYG